MIKDNSEMIARASVDLINRQQRWASLAVIIARDTGRVLVVRRKGDGQIGLPCGKRDGQETPEETLIREVWEETGIHRQQLDTVKYHTIIQFEGCYVSVYSAMAETEISVAPALGFSDETEPFWMDVNQLAHTESHFQSFNIVALNYAGVF